MIIERGDDPGPFSQPRDYVNHLRERFHQRCAYCRTPDDQTGRLEGMRVDHFVPESRRDDLRLIWSNLYYSCDTCNNRKSNFPTDEELAHGDRFVDPCSEDPDDNFRLVFDSLTGGYSRVEDLTPAAAYTIRRLQFNRRSDLRDFWRELSNQERSWLERRRHVLELQSKINEDDIDAEWLLFECDRELARIQERWPFPRREKCFQLRG